MVGLYSIVIKLAGLPGGAYAGLSISNSWVDSPLMPGNGPAVISGVEVLRGVRVANGMGVFSGVQVGRMVMRGVGLGGMDVSGAFVGVTADVPLAHPLRIIAADNIKQVILFMRFPPFACESDPLLCVAR